MPRTRRPLGSWLVRIRSTPAAGPAISISVSAVMRRAKRESGTTDHLPFAPRAISSTEPPWAIISTSAISCVIFGNGTVCFFGSRASWRPRPGNISSSFVYSWLTTRSPAARAVEREVAEIVVVVAELPCLRGGGLVFGIERRRAREHRVAPADQDIGIVALRHVHPVVRARRYLLEGEGRRVGIGTGFVGDGERQRRDGGGDRGDGKPAAQKVAPAVARGDDLAHRRIRAWVRGLVLGLLGRLRTGQQLLHGRFSSLSSTIAAPWRSGDTL